MGDATSPPPREGGVLPHGLWGTNHLKTPTKDDDGKMFYNHSFACKYKAETGDAGNKIYTERHVESSKTVKDFTEYLLLDPLAVTSTYSISLVFTGTQFTRCHIWKFTSLKPIFRHSLHLLTHV